MDEELISLTSCPIGCSGLMFDMHPELFAIAPITGYMWCTNAYHNGSADKYLTEEGREQIKKYVRIASGCERPKKPTALDLEKLETQPELRVLYKLPKEEDERYREKTRDIKIKRSIMDEAWAEFNARLAAEKALKGVHG